MTYLETTIKMRTTSTDNSLRMAVLPGEKSRVFSTELNTAQSRYECAIPREHWYFPPVPPKAREKPAFDSSDWRAIGITAILAAGFVATVEILHQPQPQTREVAAPPVQQSVAPVSTSMPTPEAPPVPDLPTVLPEPTTVRRAELATPVRRAALVLPEVRRADFVGLPVGWQGLIQMPDGNPVSVRYMGEVASFDQLPRQPGLGDMVKVSESEHCWVFTQPIGFSRAVWVDP